MNRVQFLPSIKGISVIGSLNENKTCQDRVRVLDGGCLSVFKSNGFQRSAKDTVNGK